MSLKKNVAANYAGQTWRAAMGLVFIPLYIKYLGIEAYGLIAIFALLQSWFALLDMGMKPSLGREMARFTAGVHDAQSIRDLLRSIEVIAFAVAGIIAGGIWLASSWLASHWVVAKSQPPQVVAQSFAVMGFVAALRFVEDIYMSCIVGLQRQVLQNVVTGTIATVRGLGAVAILAWVSPTLKAFFLWQGLISLLNVIILGSVVYHVLPRAPLRARFSKSALLGVWRFAAGMLAITVLSLALTQADKILLSRLLPLEIFGYYALAGTVAAALYTVTSPITGAVYPRLAELVAVGEETTLRHVYHQGAELVTVLAGSAAVVLITFSDMILRLWTGDSALTTKVAPLMIILVGGTLLNVLMMIPYQVQLAYGWTSLTIKTNVVAVTLLVPTLFFIVPAYGATGAAWAWVTLNAGYVLVGITLMHRRLLRNEKWIWYKNVTVSMMAAVIIAILCRSIVPSNPGKGASVIFLSAASLCTLLASGMAAPSVRIQIIRRTHRAIRVLFPSVA